jgi:hypothetical protein
MDRARTQQPPASAPKFADQENKILEIKRSRGEASSFGLPISVMQINSGAPTTPVAAGKSANTEPLQSPCTPLRPLTIYGEVSPHRSPFLFSPNGR